MYIKFNYLRSKFISKEGYFLIFFFTIILYVETQMVFYKLAGCKFFKSLFDIIFGLKMEEEKSVMA